jgi:hypothetical protein
MGKSRSPWLALFVLAPGVVACSGSKASAIDGPADAAVDSSIDTNGGDGGDGGTEASPAPADAAADVDKSLACAKTFGTELVSGYGRLDGTVLAVVPPADNACALPNADHLVLQVTMHGAAYRMVVNVKSDRAIADPRVQMKEVDAPLIGGDWAEGWHVPAGLDYPTALKVHDKDFTPYDLAPLTARITSFINVGDKISVFATNDGTYRDSAHLVHYNGSNQDGAIVVGPASASPKWLLFHFSTQVF